jgi:polar amino acid transport system substrate-binding protein
MRKCSAVILATMATAALAPGCGGARTDPAAPSPVKSLSGSALERATAILGHPPSGLAEAIVDRGSMIVADDADYAPQSSIDPTSHKLVGFDVDVAKRAAAILGLTAEFKNPAWEMVPTGLRQGKFDVSIGSMSITPQREKTLDFTAPYYYDSVQAFVKKGGEQIRGVRDLFGKTVGEGAATTYYEYLTRYPQIDVRTYTTDADAFPDLRDGKLDFVVTSGPTGQQAILSGEPFEFSGKPLFVEVLGFAIRTRQPDWLALLDYSIARMHEDGSLTAMSKKWYFGMDLSVRQ